MLIIFIHIQSSIYCSLIFIMITNRIYGLGCAYFLNKFILILVTWGTLLRRAPIWCGRTHDMVQFSVFNPDQKKIERLAVLHALDFKISVNSSENLDKHLNVWYVPAKTAMVVKLENTSDSRIGRGLY